MDSVVQFRGTVYEDGYGLIASKVMRDKKLPRQSKLIYAYICSFAGSDKEGDRSAFPSVSLQCDELGMSEDTYYRWRKPLVDAGYLSIEKRRNGESKFERNLYFIEAVPMPKNDDDTETKPNKKEDGQPYPKKSGTVNPDTVNSGTNSISSNSISFITDDDDKRTGSPVSEINSHEVEENDKSNVAEDTETIIAELREVTKEDLPTVSFNAVVRKVMDMHDQEKIGQGNFRSYLMSALTTRMQELQERREQDKASQPKKSYSPKQVKTEVLPDWFKERKAATEQQSATTDDFDVELERQKLMDELGQ